MDGSDRDLEMSLPKDESKLNNLEKIWRNTRKTQPYRCVHYGSPSTTASGSIVQVVES